MYSIEVGYIENEGMADEKYVSIFQRIWNMTSPSLIACISFPLPSVNATAFSIIVNTDLSQLIVY